MALSPYSKDHSISFPSRGSGRTYFSDQTPPAWTDTTRVVTAQRKLDGFRLSNWKELIKQGQNATTALTAVEQSIDYDNPGLIRQVWKSDTFPTKDFIKELRGDWLITNTINNANFIGPSRSINFVDNLARAQFYSKVQRETLKFQGLVFLGEMKETLRMLRRPTEGLQKLAKDFLSTLGKRKRASPKKWMKDIGGLWLEQAFGWKPFLNDINDAIQTYEHLTKPAQRATKISAGFAKSYDSTSDLPLSFRPGQTVTNPNGSSLVFDVVYALKRELHIVRYRGGIIPQVEAPSWRDPSLFGFDPSNWIPSAWELLPWSFLVDYFTNIGDILNAQGTHGFKLTYTERSQITQVDVYRRLKLDRLNRFGLGSSYYLDQSSYPSLLSQRTTNRNVSRGAGGGVPLPTLQFNFSLNDGQLLNVAALLSQANALHPQDRIDKWRGHR